MAARWPSGKASASGAVDMGFTLLPFPVNPLLTVTGKFPFIIENLVYVFGSCERHSKSTKEMYMPLKPTPK